MAVPALHIAAAAIERAILLATVLDREHTNEAVHAEFRRVRVELIAARSALGSHAATHHEPLAATAAGRRAMATKPGSARHRILKCLADCGPLTDSELQDTLTMLGSSERSRRNELCQAGLVRPARGDAGRLVRPRDQTGVDQQVWEITDEGRRSVGRLNGGQEVMTFPGEARPCRVCGFPLTTEFEVDSAGSHHSDTTVCMTNMAAMRAATAI